MGRLKACRRYGSVPGRVALFAPGCLLKVGEDQLLPAPGFRLRCTSDCVANPAFPISDAGAHQVTLQPLNSRTANHLCPVLCQLQSQDVREAVREAGALNECPSSGTIIERHGAARFPRICTRTTQGSGTVDYRPGHLEFAMMLVPLMHHRSVLH